MVIRTGVASSRYKTTARSRLPPMTTKEEIDLKYNVRPFVEAPSSKSNEPVIELDAIDLSLYQEGPEGFSSRKKLADKLEKSISTYGFFSIVNHGITKEKFDHLRSIAQSVLELPEDVKRKHLAGALRSDDEDRTKSLGGERGAGFKPRGYWSMKNGVVDAIELYNFRNMLQPLFFDKVANNYPEIVENHLDDISDYFRYLHHEVLRRLLTLCDIILEKPEGHLWENYFKVIPNDFVNSGSGFGRMMVYHDLKPEDEKKVDKNWLRGHSDSCAFTFITSQPILSLQIRDYYTGQWRYVGHTPGGLIVNISDAMEFITGGYFKSSIHRVMSPPEDQKAYKRMVLIYFCGCKFSSILNPEYLDSPKLARLGLHKSPEEWDVITYKQWDDEKAGLFGKSKVNDSPGDEPNLVLIHGRLHERWHQAEKNFDLVEAKRRFNIIEV